MRVELGRVGFTWSLEKTHLTLIQRCALTVQLHPSIAHIPGGALSTLPTRNTKQHRDTDHTIARSRSSPLHDTLLLPLSPILHDPATAIFTKGRLLPPRSIDRLRFFHPASIFPHIVHRYTRRAPLSSGSLSIFLLLRSHLDLGNSYRQRIES